MWWDSGGAGVRESWGWGLELYLPTPTLALEMPRVIPPDPTPVHPSFSSRALELSGVSALRAGTLSCHRRSRNPPGAGLEPRESQDSRRSRVEVRPRQRGGLWADGRR